MTDTSRRAIAVPDIILADPDAVELARIWFSGNEPVMALKPALTEPRHYGMVLADTVRHLARVYAREKGLDEQRAFDEICDGFQGRLEAADRGSDIQAGG